MKEQHGVTPLFEIPIAAEVENTINQHLMHDWVVRIEYSDNVELHNTQWKQWGETRFRLKTAENIMADLFSCRARYSNSNIRLSAEKLDPNTKMTFCVYKHQDYKQQQSLQDISAGGAIVARHINSAENNKWTQKINTFIQNGKTKIMKVATIVLMLMTSLFLIEELAI